MDTIGEILEIEGNSRISMSEEVDILSNQIRMWPPIEPLPQSKSKPTLPSLQTPPQVELKPLPDSLKYAFLGPDQTLPVIIASNLELNQEEKLVEVLKSHKGAIGLSVLILKGLVHPFVSTTST